MKAKQPFPSGGVLFNVGFMLGDATGGTLKPRRYPLVCGHLSFGGVPSDMHPSTEQLLKFFAYEHLPKHLQKVSKPFHDLAQEIAQKYEGPEATAGLRKLLEAKDCIVRAASLSS